MKRIRFSAERYGDGTKRRQVKRACSRCRRSKRACRHLPSEEVESSPMPDPVGHGSQMQPTQTSSFVSKDGTTTASSDNNNQRETSGPPKQLDAPLLVQSQPSSARPPIPSIPFAGPSSAHSRILSSSSSSCPSTMNGEPDLEKAILYQLLPAARRLRPSLQDIKADPSERRPGVGPAYLPMVVRAVLPYLEIECLDVLPHADDLNVLIQIYTREIHPLLPIVDFATPALASPAERSTPASIVLRQAICLAACKQASARAHLRLRLGGEDASSSSSSSSSSSQNENNSNSNSGSAPFALQTPRDFGDRLFGSLKIALDIGLVDDRLELVQVLALMALHSYGLDGDDEVARLCGQAVHYAYAAGLHHHQRQQQQPPSSSGVGVGVVPEERRVELVCSLFALDKIIATVTGRPTVAHAREMRLPEGDDRVWQVLPPGLRMLFRLSQILDRVLDLYRGSRLPGSPEDEEDGYIWEDSWPDFEELARECGIETLAFPLQATLEVLYLTVSTLSYRPAPIPADRADCSSARPDRRCAALRSARARQGYAAQQIISLPILEMAMLPFVPYAASLALSAGLRGVREASLESVKRRASNVAEASLNILEELAQACWLAESSAKTGRRLSGDLLGVRPQTSMGSSG